MFCKSQLAFVNPSILVIQGVHMLRKKFIFFLCFGHSTIAVAYLKSCGMLRGKGMITHRSSQLRVVLINHHPKFFSQSFSVQIPLDPCLPSRLRQCHQWTHWGCLNPTVHVTNKNFEQYHKWILSQTFQVSVPVWDINFSFLGQLWVSVMRSGYKPAHSHQLITQSVTQDGWIQ